MTWAWSSSLSRSLRLRGPPKLEYTSSTRVPRACASRIRRRPTSPVIRPYPRCFVLIAPLVVWVTLNRASVVRGVRATWATIPSPSISQYGR